MLWQRKHGGETAVNFLNGQKIAENGPFTWKKTHGEKSVWALQSV